MSTEESPFTDKSQVENHIKQCRDSGMNTRNHKFYINTAVMRIYFNPKDPVIEKFAQQNRMCISFKKRSKVHTITIDYWDEIDEQEEQEYRLELYIQNKQWGQDTGLLSNNSIDTKTHEDWQLINGGNDIESDITPLLGLRNRSVNINT